MTRDYLDPNYGDAATERAKGAQLADAWWNASQRRQDVAEMDDSQLVDFEVDQEQAANETQDECSL